MSDCPLPAQEWPLDRYYSEGDGEGDKIAAAVVTMDTGPGIQRIEEQLNDLLSMVSTRA